MRLNFVTMVAPRQQVDYLCLAFVISVTLSGHFWDLELWDLRFGI